MQLTDEEKNKLIQAINFTVQKGGGMDVAEQYRDIYNKLQDNTPKDLRK